MKRTARLKQKRRLEEQRQLELDEKKQISRRSFLIWAGSLAIFSGAGILLYHLNKTPTYGQALQNKHNREKWAESLVSKLDVPNYTNVSYADEEKYNGLRNKYPGKIGKPEDVFAISIPRDEENIARGTKTDIYLSPGCFLDVYKNVPQTWKDLDLIIGNVVTNHEMLHADHFNHGIEEYNLENFYNNNGEFNKEIFMSVSEILGHKKEFDGLLSKRDKATSVMFSEYLKYLPALVIPYFNAIYGSNFTKDLDENFVLKLRTDLAPEKVF